MNGLVDRATRPDTKVVAYQYDAASNRTHLTPLGRRKQKIATGPFAGTTNFLPDGNQEIAEYDGAGTLAAPHCVRPRHR